MGINVEIPKESGGREKVEVLRRHQAARLIIKEQKASPSNARIKRTNPAGYSNAEMQKRPPSKAPNARNRFKA